MPFHECMFIYFFSPGSGRFKIESLKENWCRTNLKRPRLKPDMREGQFQGYQSTKTQSVLKIVNLFGKDAVRPVIQILKDSKMVVHGNKDWLKFNWPWNVPNQSVRIKRRCRIYLPTIFLLTFLLTDMAISIPKGQLFSRYPFGVFKSTRKLMKFL